ncbi:MAG TPA: lasso peptide biosynthesis B2 protein [Gemmatimonadaceae bacterium]
MGALTRKVISLGVREWRELWRAQWALILAQRVVSKRAPGQLTSRASTLVSAAHAQGSEARSHARALGDAVRRAAKYGIFRPACLVQAIAIQRLLSADGIQGAIIKVGVKQAEAGMEAHAWVELEGDVIGDSLAHVREFAPLNELSVLS